jgi:hypothetical protein
MFNHDFIDIEKYDFIDIEKYDYNKNNARLFPIKKLCTKCSLCVAKEVANLQLIFSFLMA